MKEKPPIYVTQPYLPPLEEFVTYLEKIWENKWLTNSGPFHEQLERRLESYLGVPCVSLLSNGTMALIVALQALRVSGEVITTPYSFVATSHALHWNGIQPVFADINPDTLNLDPRRIEAAITPRTTAILPVHVYGNPCDLEEIQRIADVYGLRVIYDAAHAFGVTLDRRSVLNYGDMSILSFHATKAYNTFEGGAIACRDEKLKRRVDFLKNFGFADEVTVMGPGINAKMSEFQAAFGLLQLDHMEKVTAARKALANRYREELEGVKGIRLIRVPDSVHHSYTYFPILVQQGYPISRDELYGVLRRKGVHARRYFYPLISEFPVYRGLESSRPENLPVAASVSRQILCLPIFPALTFEQQAIVIDAVRTAG